MKKNWQFLDGDMLKIIAAVTMLIDHIGASLLETILYSGNADVPYWLYEADEILRSIGRTAFPIFAFLLAEGFFYTRSRKKYLGRLLAFAFFSEIPFNLAFHGFLFYPGGQNVFWTLAIGFLVIWGVEEVYKRYETGRKLIRKNGIYENGSMESRGRAGYRAAACLLAVMAIWAGWLAAVLLRTDYNGYGVLLIALFYFGKHAKIPRILTCIAGYLLFLWEPWCLGAFVLILFYNGEKKKRGKGFQYFFYLFYPVHLLILGVIRVVFLAD